LASARRLPVGEVTRLSYAGQELFIDTNNNGRPDAGDVFEGVVAVTAIVGAASGTDLSAQLADREITSRFRFSVTGNSSDFSHLEFGLLPGDSFNLFVGQGGRKISIPPLPTLTHALRTANPGSEYSQAYFLRA
jgi:hypothetical protein